MARYAGLTGSPDESGAQRREQGLARAGNARVRRDMIQLAWRFLMFRKESALTLWYCARTADTNELIRQPIWTSSKWPKSRHLLSNNIHIEAPLDQPYGGDRDNA